MVEDIFTKGNCNILQVLFYLVAKYCLINVAVTHNKEGDVASEGKKK